MSARWLGILAVFLTLAGEAHADPCADDVSQFLAGGDGGYQADLLPWIVLGPPFGRGTERGSVDVVSLGDDGSITLAFEDNAVVDGPGIDFIVFENPFRPRGAPTAFIEAGIVAASEDGAQFYTFPWSAARFVGLAGVTPVLSHPDNDVDPRSSEAGGDGFDLALIGLDRARFVRITDPGEGVHDPGNDFPVVGFGQSGFDLDAVVARNSVETCAECCDATGDGVLRINDAVVLLSHLLGNPTAFRPCGMAPCRARHCADANGSQELDLGDVVLCLRKTLGHAVDCAPGLCDLP